MDWILEALVRAFSTNPGIAGARDGQRGYPSDGHGIPMTTYGIFLTETQPVRAEEEPERAAAKEAAHG